MYVHWYLFRGDSKILQNIQINHSLPSDIVTLIMKDMITLYYCNDGTYEQRIEDSKVLGERVSFIYTHPVFIREKVIIYRKRSADIEKHIGGILYTPKGRSIVSYRHPVVYYYNTRNLTQYGNDIIREEDLDPALHGDVVMETSIVLKYINIIRNNMYRMSQQY